jgi:hypothetical protein
MGGFIIPANIALDIDHYMHTIVWDALFTRVVWRVLRQYDFLCNYLLLRRIFKVIHPSLAIFRNPINLLFSLRVMYM